MPVERCGEPEGKTLNFSPSTGRSAGKTLGWLWTDVPPVRCRGPDRRTTTRTGGSGLGLHLDGDRYGHLGVELHGELVGAHVLDHVAHHLSAVDLEADLGH